MSELSIQQQKQLNIYLKNNPNVSRDTAIKSLFGGEPLKANGKGISVENSSSGKKTLTLPSGCKVVLNNGKTAYYAPDGKTMNQKSFEAKEGIIDLKNSGRYSIRTKNGVKYYAADGTELKETYFNAKEGIKQNVTFKTSDGKNVDITKTMQKRLNNVNNNLKQAEDNNGFVGKAWSGFKNLTGIGDSSDKVRDLTAKEQKLLKTFTSDSKNKEKIFMELTGQSFTSENLEKFIKGEIKLKSEMALSGYKEGQEMAVDLTGDIVSGVAAVGVYTLAIAAAPLTGGASIAVGVAAAAAAGAGIKAGVKALDAVSGGREYKDLKKDLATGAFSGVLAPVTGGLGGAVGKTVATKVGIQAVKTVGKEAVEEVVETGIKQTVKTALTNPAGYKYAGGNFMKKGLAYGAEMATDGAVGGAVDNSFRKAVDGGSVSDVVQAAGEGVVGGLIMSPIVGGGFKGAGKIGHELSKVLPFNEIPKDVPSVVIPKKTLTDLYPASDASEIALMKQNLSKSASGIEQLELKEIITLRDGTYNIYKKTQSGSNPGFWAENKETGELFYFKTGNGTQNVVESVSSQIYRAAGIDTPEYTLIATPTFGSGGLKSDDCWIKSKAVTGLKSINENPKAAYEGFAVDAWLANWDAVCSGNTLLKDGTAVRLDFDGTLDFRAQGARKTFGNNVPELSTLLNPEINPESSAIFKNMTREDLISSLKRVQSVTDTDIQSIHNSVNVYINPEVFTALSNRKEYLKYILKEAQTTKMNSDENIAAYVKKLEMNVSKKYKKQINATNAETAKRKRIMSDMKEQRDANTSEDGLKRLWDVKNGYCWANDAITKGSVDNFSAKKLDEVFENLRLTEPVTLYRGDHFRIDSHMNFRYADDFPELKDKRLIKYDEKYNGNERGKTFVEDDNYKQVLTPMSELIKKIYKKGKIVEEKQFLSTTVNPNVAKTFGKGDFDIIYKYNAPKNLKSTTMEQFSTDITGERNFYIPESMNLGTVEGSEMELFLARGFKYQMKNLTFENGHYVIECDILPPKD